MELSAIWEQTQAELPSGWKLDGLRCASTGLRPEQRSDDWIAVAVNEAGQTRESRAADPAAALHGLVDSIRLDARS